MSATLARDRALAAHRPIASPHRIDRAIATARATTVRIQKIRVIHRHASSSIVP